MNARQQRAVRGGAVSFAATLLAATAHTLAGGGAPSPWLVAAVALLSSPIAVAVVGRTPSAARTALAVVTAQIVFHTAFAVAPASSAMSAPMAHMSHDHLWASMPAVAAASAPAGESLSLPMLTLHACAAALTALLVHRGERMLRAVSRGLARLLPVVAWAAPHPPVARRTSPIAAVRLPRLVLFSIGRPRRGPPALVPTR